MTRLPDAFLTRPITHRALHDANVKVAENNIAAIDAAIEGGYGIEIDVQLSKCGTAMVFHDYQLDRLTDAKGAIAQQHRDELAEVAFKTGEIGVPTLAHVLEHVDGRAPLLVEIKDQDGQMGPHVGALETSVADALAGYSGDIAIMSFNPHSVMRMAELCPDHPRGITSCSFPQDYWQLLPQSTRETLAKIPDYEKVGASFISHQWNDLTAPRVQELKRQGAKILCWTVRSAADESIARQVADNITFELYTAS